MRVGKKILALTLSLVAMAGCESEWELPYSPQAIRFSVGGKLDITTKGPIDQTMVNDHTVPVRVTATRGGSNLYTNEQIFRNAETGEWLPTQYQQKEWTTDIRHTFYANAYHPTNATSNGSLTITSPTNIVIQQPATYDEESKGRMVDYLLSQNFVYTVPMGSRPPLVKLMMEHAVTMVEINIAKHISFQSTSVYLKMLTLEGFYRSATMTCPTLAQYGKEGESNAENWQYTARGTKDAVYTIEGAAPFPAVTSECVPLSVRDDEDGVRMTFLATPQQLEEGCKLTVGYWVNEKYRDDLPDNFVYHESSFNLFDYRTVGNVALWAPGHHVVYTLEVDTGITLEGTIAPWVDVDYIEGTVLPVK